jgi:hypothetical protein
MSRPSKHSIPDFEEFVTDNKPNQLCWNYISKLSNVVVVKYFGKYLTHFDKNDLVSLAITDALAFANKVIATNTGKEIQNVRNVFFTRIRNTVSNFVFRSNRLIDTEDDVLDKQVVYPKVFEIKSDLIDQEDLAIDSINSFREVSLKTWNLYKTNSAFYKYTINKSTDDINEWKSYSEIKNMKIPCDLLPLYENYTEDQIEELANKLDEVYGQNYFNTLYQLLGDKFLAFLDVFQEDKFTIPSTNLVKNLLVNLEMIEDHKDGLTVHDLCNKYDRTEVSVKRVLESEGII